MATAQTPCNVRDNNSADGLLQIINEEICKQQVDVIVTAIGTGLELANNPVCRAIRKTRQGQKDLDAMYKRETEELSNITVTRGGKLKCKFVIHLNLPRVLNKQVVCDRLLECLQMADTKLATSIAFPGFENKKYNSSAFALCMTETFYRYETCESTLKSIRIATTDEDMLRALWLARGKMDGLRATRLRTVDAQFMDTRHILTVTVGDIEKQETDVVVVSTTPTMLIDVTAGAITKAVINGGGKKLTNEIKKKHPKGIKVWEIARTSGGDLHCSHIYHTRLAAWTDDAQIQKHLTELILNSLTCAAQCNLHSVAFPVLGAGIMRFPVEKVATCMVKAFDEFFENHPNSTIEEMRIVLHYSQTPMQEIFERANLITETTQPEQEMRRFSVNGKELKEDEICTFELDRDSTEFELVANSFQQWVHGFTVIQIERIANAKLFNAYMRVQDQIKRANPGLILSQRMLWRSVRKRDIDVINENGFTRAESGPQGRGLYFFTDPNEEETSTIKPDCEGKLYIYKCQVLIGEFTSGSECMTTPPSKSMENIHSVFDSVTDDVVNSRRFIVFNKNQVYPKCLITYTIEKS